MVRRPKARELIAGLADDPTFGPVVVFGRGGTAVEVINDKSLALPPLDLKLAEMLIARTQVSRILKAYRDVPAADERAIRLVLVKLSQLAADVPEIRELDINPFLADENGVIAVDARVRVAAETAPQRGLRPSALRGAALPEGVGAQLRAQERPQGLRPPGAARGRGAVPRVPQACQRRGPAAALLRAGARFQPRLPRELIQIDYARAIAFVALDADSGEMIGVVRLHADANHETGEYAILLRSDLKGQGLGWELMQLIIEWAKADGLSVIEGQVLRENTVMLDMASGLGFEIRSDASDRDLHIVTLRLEDTHSARRVGHFPATS